MRRLLIKLLTGLRYKNMLPKEVNQSDLFIVEFPKSGITWLSTIIANILLLEGKAPIKATYFNIQQLIPDIHLGRSIQFSPFWKYSGFRFIKSHHTYCPLYNNVIYIVRHPYSVMTSYFHYCKSMGQFEGDLDSFIKSDRYGITKWDTHVRGWLDRKSSSQRIHLIKYEELIEDPINTINYLFKNLGYEVLNENIRNGIQESEFIKMKENEALYNKHNPHRTFSFVREGKKDYKIEERNKKYILSISKDIIEKLGYHE